MRFHLSYLPLLALLPVLGLLPACDSGGDGVSPPPPAAVTVTFSTAAPTISQGDTVTVLATASDGNAVTYSSSAPAVASATTSGRVLGVGAGSATIRATSGSATADLAVTVQALTPSVSIGALTRDGQPLDANDLSGAFDVEVDYEIGNAFNGEIVVFADSVEVGRVSLDGGSGGGPAGAASSGPQSVRARVKVGSRKVAATVSQVSVEELPGGGVTIQELLANGPTNLTAGLYSSGSAVGSPSTPFSAGVNNPPQVYVHVRGQTSATAVNGTPIMAPIFIDGVYLGRGDPRTVAGIDVAIEQVEIIQGPAAVSLYGAQAAGGVVNIVLDPSKPWTQGGNAIGGMAALRRLSSATVRFTDNSTLQPALLNANPNLTAPLQGLDLYWDLAPAAHRTGGSHYRPTDDFYLGAGLDFSAFSASNGFAWAGASPDIVDVGWEPSLSCEWKMGANLSTLVPILSSDELTEGQPYKGAVECVGELNTGTISIGKNFYGDFTLPTASLLAGPNFLADGDVNPAGKMLAFTGTDAGSGFDPNLLHLGISRSDASGTTFEVGADNGQGGFALADVALATPGRYSDLEYGTGYHQLEWKIGDKAGNLSLGASLRYTVDYEPPVAAVTQAPSTGTPGAALSFGWSLTDNLDLHYQQAYIRYDAQTAIGSGPEEIGQPYDAQYTTQVTGQWQPNLIQNFEWASQGVAPTGTTLHPERAFVGGIDFGGNGTYVDEDLAGRFSGSTTDTWRPRGYDWLTVNIGSFQIDAEGDTRTVEVEARTAGTPIADQVRLYARSTVAQGDLRWVMIPVSDAVPVTMQDNGGWYQEFATPVLDTGKYPLPAYSIASPWELFALIFDEDYNVLASKGNPFTVNGLGFIY